MKISILIPCYNHAAFIEQSIRSVWDQDYLNIELIIVDDGSKDNSLELIANLKSISPIEMIVVEQKNGGICKALNHALKVSSGDLIGVLASDDIMLPKRISHEIKYFNSQENLKVLYSSGRFKSDDRIFGDIHKSIKPTLKRGIIPTRNYLLNTVPAFFIQAMLIKRDFLLNIGGFDEETGSDDWSLHIRIFQSLRFKDEFIFLDRFAFLYRIHEAQMHKAEYFMSPMKRRVIRKYFSLENRSKYICQNLLKQALAMLIKLKFKSAKRYISKARYIGFSKGIPITCLIKCSFALPTYIYRVFIR
jgi:alpha-1,3-rhamnosyltransferase